jgi:hypothetical protein
MRSLGVSAGVYQSVMMTPPNGSAETSGMKLMVSRDARHRYAFTATPVPVSSLFSALEPNRPPGPNSEPCSCVRPPNPDRTSFRLRSLVGPVFLSSLLLSSAQPAAVTATSAAATMLTNLDGPVIEWRLDLPMGRNSRGGDSGRTIGLRDPNCKRRGDAA